MTYYNRSSLTSIKTENSSHQSAWAGGLKVKRLFSRADVRPFDEIDWVLRQAQIATSSGEIIFKQDNVEAPKNWSQTAVNIMASKYLQGRIGTQTREHSARQLIGRVAKTISDFGREQGYFASSEDADIFEMELTHILINQKAAFNTPVWLNVGINKNPQCSACFINGVEDDMRSILGLAVTVCCLNMVPVPALIFPAYVHRVNICLIPKARRADQCLLCAVLTLSLA